MTLALKVLIVDDLASLRKVLRRLLEKIGFTEIVEAGDGQEAFEILTQQPFQLVISDWEMPRLKGIELLRKMQENEQLKDIPFVMITSNNQKENVIEAASNGVKDYISKPFSAQVLREKLSKFMPDIDTSTPLVE